MKDLNDALKDFREAWIAMEKLNSKLPTVAGVEALRVIEKNFDNESYDTGNGKVKWEARSEKTNAAYDKRYGVRGSVFNSANKLLRQTGNLFDSIRKRVAGMVVFIFFDTKKVPYGQVHNEGDSEKNIPQRQFMPMPNEPENPAIMKALFRKYSFERERIMRKFKV